MVDGRLSKDFLYGELGSGFRLVGHPMLRYKDECKRHRKFAEINPDSWEAASANRNNWHCVVRSGVKRAEAMREQLCNDGREQRRVESLSKTAFRITATETAIQELDLQ